MTVKLCVKCNEAKPISDFPVNRKMRDGLDSWCKFCHRVAAKEHSHRHPEKGIAYRSAHPEKGRVYTKTYRDKNLEKTRASAREYSMAHMEDIKAWHKAHPEKVREWSAKKRALKARAGGGGVTAEQFEQIKQDYGYRCAYCNERKPLELDHVVPLSKKGLHDISNAVPACRSCNSKKNNSSLLMFLYRRLSNA